VPGILRLDLLVWKPLFCFVACVEPVQGSVPRDQSLLNRRGAMRCDVNGFGSYPPLVLRAVQCSAVHCEHSVPLVRVRVCVCVRVSEPATRAVFLLGWAMPPCWEDAMRCDAMRCVFFGCGCGGLPAHTGPGAKSPVVVVSSKPPPHRRWSGMDAFREKRGRGSSGTIQVRPTYLHRAGFVGVRSFGRGCVALRCVALR